MRRTTDRAFAFRAALAALAAGAGLHCAHVEAPPGGPIDTIPPVILAAYPAPGAVGVARTAVPTLRFSEWIDRDAARGHVLLSPPLPGRLKGEVDGDRLVLHPPQALRPNTAYRLMVLGTVKDLHGVSMGRAFSLAFSTGNGFDSGSVAGRIVVSDRKGAAFAALYRAAGRDSNVLPRSVQELRGFKPDSTPAPGRELPAFIVSADSLGSFALDSVTQGVYGLLAFEDVDGNLLPDVGIEPMAIGPAELRLQPRAPEQYLRLAVIDTLPLRVHSARIAADTEGGGKGGTVEVQFTGEAYPASAADPEHYHLLESSGDSGRIAHMAPISAVGWDPISGAWILAVDSLRAGAHYRLMVNDVADPSGRRIAAPGDTAECTAATVDSAAWSFSFLNLPDASGYASLRMPNDLPPDAVFRLRSNRRLSAMRWSILNQRLEVRVDTTPVKSLVHLLSPVEFSLQLDHALRPGQTLHLRLHPVPPDSVFKVLAAGQAIDSAHLGGLEFAVPKGWKGWTFLLQSLSPASESVIPMASADSAASGSIDAGLYRIAAFWDRDHDGIWNPGSLKPWIPQEPYAVLADSIRVTAGAATDATARLALFDTTHTP